MWPEIARHAPGFAGAVLTCLEADGYPLSLRVAPRLDPQSEVLRLDLPSGLRPEPGPACLLYHRHDERLGGLRSFVVRGALLRADDGYFLRPETYVPGVGVSGWRGYLRFVVDGRRTAARYLARRGLPRPRLRWEGWDGVLDRPRDSAPP